MHEQWRKVRLLGPFLKIQKRGIKIDRATRATRYKGFNFFFPTILSPFFLRLCMHCAVLKWGQSMNGKKYHVHNNGCGCFECHEGKNGINQNEWKKKPSQKSQEKKWEQKTEKRKRKQKKAAQSQRDKKYSKRHKTENTSNILLKGGLQNDKKWMSNAGFTS